jgi:phytoene dehydrogenase-like protein
VKAPPDAVVIGAGHNGLVAANVLADAGWSVLVLEAEPEPGGSVRSAELIEPGFVNDRFSAFYPLGAASPVFRALALDIPWRHGPLVLAHPSGDGSCPVISRDVDETAASLGVDGERWHELMRAWARAEPAVLRGMTTPFPQLRAAFELGLEPSALRLLRPGFRGEHARRLLLGNALHTDIPPHSPLGRAFGLLLAAFGQQHGFPCIEGGAGRLTGALVARAVGRGVEIRCGERVERLARVRARRAVLAAVDAWTLARLLGRAPRTIPDPATLKVDWTLDGPVPWLAENARRAPVVHLGDERAFTIFGQYSLADPTRMPAGKEVAWAYSHLLPDAGAIEDAIERLAPGFRSLIRGRHVTRLPPGRVNGGTMRLHNQLVFRGHFGRAETGVPGVYLASSSAHPGGGVHGAPGWIAARTALAHAARDSALRRRREPGAASFTSSST